MLLEAAKPWKVGFVLLSCLQNPMSSVFAEFKVDHKGSSLP